MSDSDLMFGDEETPTPDAPATPQGNDENWRVLVVDDEEQVHKITSLVLQTCDFDGSPIELTHAYSQKEAQEILKNQDPFALALVDVVMETDDAGLQLVEFIREELGDHNIRLVLRTGQPGQAPEETVIHKYDINDYKNKTELTSTKLKTLLYSTLRSYRDIITISRNRQGLYHLINATSKIVDADQLSVFSSAVLKEVGNLLNLHEDAVCAHCTVDALAAKCERKHYEILAATGKLKDEIETKHKLPDNIIKYFEEARTEHHGLHGGDVYVGYYQTPSVGENFLYVKPQSALTKMAIHLLDMYTRCVAITHHNLQQKEDIHRSRQELVYVLSETIERRRPSESNHVRRVSKMSDFLACAAGLDPMSCERIKLASALHDIGTIAIADDILEKTTVYSEEERVLMQAHAQIGESILGRSKRPVLKLAATIAGQHHEHWNGKGYPNGLSGTEINIAARIVSLTDVIDAMLSERPYRQSHSTQAVKEHIKSQLGLQFDPEIGRVALDVFDDLIQIRLESNASHVA